MAHIVADILSLLQYFQSIKADPTQYRPERCCNCGKANPWWYGYYYRKADRTNPRKHSLNPIPIHRGYCKGCKKTFSVLPECIPKARWYLWEVQQIALTLLLGGASLRAAARMVAPSRRTIARWCVRFQEQFRLHKDVLCKHFTELGRATDFIHFWQACLNKIILAKAMRICHVDGVAVP